MSLVLYVVIGKMLNNAKSSFSLGFAGQEFDHSFTVWVGKSSTGGTVL